MAFYPYVCMSILVPNRYFDYWVIELIKNNLKNAPLSHWFKRIGLQQARTEKSERLIQAKVR